MVKPRGKAKTGKGTCKCEYYKRTTTFIDVVQDEFKLKQWDRRMVAYGMGQRPDLVLAAASVRGDTDPNQDDTDKRKLQAIADDAKAYAKGSAAATTGTSLHTLTEWIDTGQTLGHVPEPYPADLRAYEDVIKDIEWVKVESFRVHDEWKVAGTADRIGWYRGRLTVFDIKTGSIFFEAGPAMQLAMYGRSTPYDIATDTRQVDVTSMNLNVAYVIHLPAGSGHCELKPVDIVKGWGACRIARQVWELRAQKYFVGDSWLDDNLQRSNTYTEMALRAGTVTELKMLWRNASDQGSLTDELKQILTNRANDLKGETQ
jgi:hypothetical protein